MQRTSERFCFHCRLVLALSSVREVLTELVACDVTRSRALVRSCVVLNCVLTRTREDESEPPPFACVGSRYANAIALTCTRFRSSKPSLILISSNRLNAIEICRPTSQAVDNQLFVAVWTAVYRVVLTTAANSFSLGENHKIRIVNIYYYSCSLGW